MKIWGILATVAIFLMIAAPAYALVAYAPNVAVHASPQAYRNVVAAGDVLVIYRTSLETVDWTPYGPEGVIITLAEGATKFQSVVPFEIGESMGAFYVTTATPTWNGTATVTVTPSPSIFTNSTPSVQPVTFESTYTATSLCNDIRALLTAVENQSASDTIAKGDYVTPSSTTVAGTTVALNAFGSIAVVLPECFNVGLESPTAINNVNNPSLGVGRSSLTSDIEATAAWTRFTTLANEWGFNTNAKARTLAAILGFAFAGIALSVSLVAFGSAQFGAEVAALTLLVAAINASGLLLQITFVLLIVATFLAASTILRGMAR